MLLALLIRKAASEVGSQVELDRAVRRGWVQSPLTTLIRQRSAFQMELDTLTKSAGRFLPVQAGTTEVGIGLEVESEPDFGFGTEPDFGTEPRFEPEPDFGFEPEPDFGLGSDSSWNWFWGLGKVAAIEQKRQLG